MSSSPRYYYVDAQNQAAGPIPLAELQSLHASSTIGDTTLVVLEEVRTGSPFPPSSRRHNPHHNPRHNPHPSLPPLNQSLPCLFPPKSLR